MNTPQHSSAKDVTVQGAGTGAVAPGAGGGLGAAGARPNAEASASSSVWRPARLLFWARRLVLAYAAIGAGYLMWRFEVQTLPSGGVSPLVAYRPGAHLLVDTRARDGRVGDALLFHDELGRLLLGRVAERPSAADAPPGSSDPGSTGLWLLSDREDTELPDSRTLGAVPRERIAGRVVCAIPGFD